jgi:hypothetical protein
MRRDTTSPATTSSPILLPIPATTKTKTTPSPATPQNRKVPSSSLWVLTSSSSSSPPSLSILTRSSPRSLPPPPTPRRSSVPITGCSPRATPRPTRSLTRPPNSWDPSVKALTAFPQVLAQMDHDIAWTTDLGNAYYNQPQDVMQTLQVLRQRALTAGTLQNTPQESVSDNQGYIQLAPVNPQIVYVPGLQSLERLRPAHSALFRLLAFRVSGVVCRVSGSCGSAPASPWAPSTPPRLAGPRGLSIGSGESIFFHQSNYMTHSTTVAHWNSPARVGPSRGLTPRPMDRLQSRRQLCPSSRGFPPGQSPVRRQPQ